MRENFEVLIKSKLTKLALQTDTTKKICFNCAEKADVESLNKIVNYPDEYLKVSSENGFTDIQKLTLPKLDKITIYHI